MQTCGSAIMRKWSSLEDPVYYGAEFQRWREASYLVGWSSFESLVHSWEDLPLFDHLGKNKWLKSLDCESSIVPCVSNVEFRIGKHR